MKSRIASTFLATFLLPVAGVAHGAESSAVVDARAFFQSARQGDIGETVEVYLNVGGARKVLTEVETAKILRFCDEGALRDEKILNPDGSITPGEETVTTRFTCAGELETYNGSAGVVLFKAGKIVRLVLQVDGYAPAFLKGRANG